MQRNSVNKVLLVGHVGGDAEVRYTPKGTPVANLSIATNESRKDNKGDRQDHTEWHKVILFGKLAEFAEQYIKKGALLFLEGRLQTRSWEDKEEQRHFVTEIIGERVTMLGGRKVDEQSEEPPIATVAEGDTEEEVPF